MKLWHIVKHMVPGTVRRLGWRAYYQAVSYGVQKYVGSRSWAAFSRSKKSYTVKKQPNIARSNLLSGQITPECQELYDNLVEKNWADKYSLYQPLFESVRHRRQIRFPSISVIVVSWRLHPDTIKNFEALFKQRDMNYELVFVDNGGLPGEFDCLKTNFDISIRLNQNTGACLARNVGAVFTKAPVLLFLDDDGIPSLEIVAAFLSVFAKYDVIAVRGAVLPKTNTPLNSFAQHNHLGDRPFPIYADIEGNNAYKSGFFFRVGGWDEDIWGGEGIDLSLRLLGIEPDVRKQIYSPKPVLYHDFAQDQEHLLSKLKRHNKSLKILLQKHPDYRSRLNNWDKYFQREDLLLKKSQ
jgi:GT2 family glycosyltransferase